MTQQSDAAGKFNFSDVPTGLYALQVSKAGFQTYRNESIAAFIGETVTVTVTLSAASFSTLRTIATVSTRSAGVAQINTSTAAINTISAQVFADQGAQQVTNVLNQTPGIFTTPYNPNNGNPNNNASPGSIQTPQIRGALPYETESLIDGHPVSVGSAGTFSPTLINPFLLEDVELVKGPGSMPAEINYAVNGTVNYRTLEPTAQNHTNGMFSTDGWGGISTGIKLTGETKNHKIGYALGYVTYGAPGPLKNFTYDASALPLYGAAGLGFSPTGNLTPYTVNTGAGAQIIGGLPLSNGAALGINTPPASFGPYGVTEQFAEPVIGCCFQSDTGYHSTSELGKLVFNFSNNTSLKLSYLGGQSTVGNGDASGTYTTDQVANTGSPFMYFAPCGSSDPQGQINCINFLPALVGGAPAPYAGTPYNCNQQGAPACGSAMPFDLTAVNGLGFTWTQQNLFQGEFRTTIGETGTLLARYYTGSLNSYTSEGAPAGTPLTYTMQTWGALPLCPVGDTYYNVVTGCSSGAQPTMTPFNGTDVTYSAIGQGAYVSSNDTMNGETLEFQEQAGQNTTLTAAYDRSLQKSSALEDEPSVGLVSNAPAPGSSQTFNTISLRGSFQLNPKLLMNAGVYFINYQSHFSPDGGLTWGDSTHTYTAPRLAFTYHPEQNTVYRFSAGGGVAPPYMGQLSGDALPTSWSNIIGGVPSLGYILNANNGELSPETSFAYDFGMDHRIVRSLAFTGDIYFTQLHNLFLPETSLLTPAEATALGCPGAAPGPAAGPCYLSKAVNLGQARYEGIEFGLDDVPVYGLGWKLQGYVQRAFTYNLPPYFYCAAPGPGCTNDINLSLLPESNFGGQPTGLLLGDGGIGSGRVPYAGGYGELNWLGHHGQYYNLNLTYFGNNNPFNQPGFFVLGGNLRIDLNNRGTKVQLSATNITGTYSNPYPGYFNGIPLPLVNGATGAGGAPIAFAPTPYGNFGPTTLRLIFTQDF